MPSLLISALTSVVVAFFLNAAFQTRRDIRTSADDLYKATEKYRSAYHSRLYLLETYATFGKTPDFEENWNSLRDEICESRSKIKVMIATEFTSLSARQIEIKEFSRDIVNMLLKAQTKKPISIEEVWTFYDRIDSAVDSIQSSLIKVRNPTWCHVIKHMLSYT